MTTTDRSRILQVLLLTAVLLAPTNGEAATTKKKSPYAGAKATLNCGALAPATCAPAYKKAVRATGRLTMQVGVTAPADGAMPGYGDADGQAYVRVSHRLRSSVPSVSFKATVRVLSARATHTGTLSAKGFSGIADANLWAFAAHSKCPTCLTEDIGDAPPVASLRGPRSRSNDMFTIRFKLVNPPPPGLTTEPHSEKVPPGTVTVTIGINALTRLDGGITPDTGIVKVTFDAVVKEIRIKT